MDKTTEREIQAQVEFKMNELLTAVENTANANWSIAFSEMNQKHTHYWEAFNQMKQMLLKEMRMPPPYDQMAEQRRREERDKAVDRLVANLIKKGDHDYQSKVRVIVSTIESVQN